ncbi:MAG: hypothetical protein A2Y97_01775 [Nitrospirae bacterium RBG_13_39_12]|nr:MAG: hypothetical protein A2Y97_01775 [Nitrospirae bacterium RBG_13_39_12]
MLERIYRLFAVLAASAGLILFLCNCATIPGQAETEESLRSTASNYWKMRLEGKLEDTFKMEDKERLIERNREGFPLNEYYKAKARLAAPIVSFKINSVSIEDGNKGRVDVEFGLTMPQVPYPVPQLLTDEWIFKNGRWQHLLH